MVLLTAGHFKMFGLSLTVYQVQLCVKTPYLTKLDWKRIIWRLVPTCCFRDISSEKTAALQTTSERSFHWSTVTSIKTRTFSTYKIKRYTIYLSIYSLTSHCWHTVQLMLLTLTSLCWHNVQLMLLTLTSHCWHNVQLMLLTLTSHCWHNVVDVTYFNLPLLT
jgi:hypothetical protein